MILKSFMFEHGHLEVNLFIMADEETREAILIDAGVIHPSVLEFIEKEKLNLDWILITHHHFDHIDALPEYLKKWGAQVFSPAPLPSAPLARIVMEGDTFQIGKWEFRVFKTSGHTPESISYYCERARVCFVGDAIFAGSVGGTTTDELHAEETGHLHSKILTLPPETELYSGHGPATTVAIEKAANPFLQPGFTRLAQS